MPGDDLRLFYRIKVLALEILLGTDHQHLLVADLPYHHWQRTAFATLDTDTPREAVTLFELDQLWPDYALLRVRLETGRMHQIRVHLAAVELPVAGDPVYGVPAPPLGRQFLHATELAFPHPFSGERIEARSELPDDLSEFLRSLPLSGS